MKQVEKNTNPIYKIIKELIEGFIKTYGHKEIAEAGLKDIRHDGEVYAELYEQFMNLDEEKFKYLINLINKYLGIKKTLFGAINYYIIPEREMDWDLEYTILKKGAYVDNKLIKLIATKIFNRLDWKKTLGFYYLLIDTYIANFAYFAQEFLVEKYGLKIKKSE